MMQGLVIDKSSPLYGRADMIMKLDPLKIFWLRKILDKDPIEIIEEYAIWGGVPRYWELRVKCNSLKEALLEHVLDRQGILHEEPSRLLLEDMRESVQAFSILGLIGSGVNRISEIAGRLGKPSTSLSRPMQQLIELGYVVRELPYGESTKTTKKTVYKIADPLMAFYFSFVVNHLSLLEIDLKDEVLTKVEKQFNSYVSAFWESLCRQAIPHISIEYFQFGPAARWWGNDINGKSIEIDIVSESINHDAVLVGEAKWSDVTGNEMSLLSQLEKKASGLPFLRGRRVIPVLFAKQEKYPHPFVFCPDKVIDVLR